jgi:hypothetical protein
MPPFDIDVRDTEPTPTPRYVPATAAQDAAARALGLSWAEWAERELEGAARRVVPAATYEPEPD